MGMSYCSDIDTFKEKYDSPTPREETRKIMSSLSLTLKRGIGKDDHAALKSLIERREVLAPMIALPDLDSEAKSWIFLLALYAETRYPHDEENIAYPYIFGAVVDALHASIRAV